MTKPQEEAGGQVMIKQKKLRGLAAYLVIAMLMSVLATGYAAPGPSAVAKELTLDEAVRMALANNPSGKIAVFDFEAKLNALTVKELQDVAKKYLAKDKVIGMLMPEE